MGDVEGRQELASVKPKIRRIWSVSGSPAPENHVDLMLQGREQSDGLLGFTRDSRERCAPAISKT
jgi:hypothetical protein